MDEAQWLKCTNPETMLEYLGNKASDRKLRLFACACCRQVWDLLPDERSRKGVEVAERFADGQASARERAAAHNASLGPADAAARKAAWAVVWATCPRMGDCIVNVSDATTEAAARAAAQTARHAGADQAAAWEQARLPSEQLQATLLRDIFGNPFRPAMLDPAWRTLTASGLAQTIYADQSFEHLPILADALEEAGCTDAAILDHCRLPGEHVRGCWVVDLLLDKRC